jgi:hypothetical protein
MPMFAWYPPNMCYADVLKRTAIQEASLLGVEIGTKRLLLDYQRQCFKLPVKSVKTVLRQL